MIRVYPRKKLDYSFRNILSALTMTISPRLDKNTIINEIESLWPRENVIVALSVRTIFDSILTGKNFEKGSEVIMTGITIPDMVKIVESHSLKIIPIDIDMERLQIKEEDVKKAISNKTVMIVLMRLKAYGLGKMLLSPYLLEQFLTPSLQVRILKKEVK